MEDIIVIVLDVMLSILISFDGLPQAKLYVIWGNITVIHTQTNLIKLKQIKSYISTAVLLKVRKFLEGEFLQRDFFPVHNAVM